MPRKPFKGIIKLDVRESTPDWEPYLAPHVDRSKWPEGTAPPNILFVLYDDTGLAAWSPFGGEINMPTLDRLAQNGLIYTQWHTAALCSPTRGMLLTGRNHHVNGNCSITEGADGFPGANARLPDECATVGQILQDNGWSTFWVGKNHNVPETDIAPGASKSQWPLAKGFDRFYGFIGGETNQWYPDLIVDNHSEELAHDHQPGFTQEGYHLSKDLADQAIQMIKDQQASNPSKPWYMWFCPGANHAPHHAPQRYVDRYKGKFIDGYEAYRERALRRMIDKGILPPGTVLTPLNPMHRTDANAEYIEPLADEVLPWASLNDDQKKLFAKLMEVYAAFSEYTDAQVGRIVDYLEQTGQLENTVIIYAADNGASGEGSPNGTVNENKFFNGYPDTIAENMATVNQIGGFEQLGGPDTYEHFPTGWAAATSTPFKMFKRYSQYAGGTCDPLVISWPRGIKVNKMLGGNIRHQYHHATDIVPTILELCKLEMPDTYRGATQHPVSGISMVYTFAAAPNAPTKKQRQYYAMLGTRGIWEEGWKASAIHAPLTGQSHFDRDRWELYHVDTDRAESQNLVDPAHLATLPKEEAEALQIKLQHLVNLWFEEAGKNQVLPLDDRSAVEQLAIVRPTEEPRRRSYTYLPGTAPVPEAVAANVRGRSYTIMADVDVHVDAAAATTTQGVVFAHGSRFGGHVLTIEGGRVHYVYNFLGIDQQHVFSHKLETGSYRFWVHFKREGEGDFGESLGVIKLYVQMRTRANHDPQLGAGDAPVAERRPWKTQTGKFTLSGDGLCVGYDSADAISKLYTGANPFRGGGVIHKVVIIPGSEEFKPSPRVQAGVFAAD